MPQINFTFCQLELAIKTFSKSCQLRNGKAMRKILVTELSNKNLRITVVFLQLYAIYIIYVIGNQNMSVAQSRLRIA